MPVPVIVGLGWLGTILFGALSGAIGFLAQYITKKLAITIVIVGIFITATASMVLAIEAVVNAISVAAPSFLTAMAGLFIPPNYSTCIGVCISARLIRWIYDQNMKILEFKAQI